MSANVSVPTKLLDDKKLEPFDIVLYLIIARNVCDYGYTKMENSTLCYKSGKSERTIQRSLERLIKQGWLKTKFNVKQNNIYDQDCKRVIWLDEFYHKYNYRTRKAKKKTVTNDYKEFLKWLKLDLKGIVFPVELGGVVSKYMIQDIKHQGKIKQLLQVLGEDGKWHGLEPSDSKDVYNKMWRNKSVYIEWAKQAEVSRQVQNLNELANSKRV